MDCEVPDGEEQAGRCLGREEHIVNIAAVGWILCLLRHHFGEKFLINCLSSLLSPFCHGQWVCGSLFIIASFRRKIPNELSVLVIESVLSRAVHRNLFYGRRLKFLCLSLF